MPDPSRTDASPSSDLDGRVPLGVGALLLVGGAVLLAWGWNLDGDSTGFQVVTALGALLFVLGLFGANTGLQRWRAGRAAQRFGPHDWAAVCVQAERHLLLRVLVVEPDEGAHLLTLGGNRLVTWPWTALRGASVESVQIQGRTRTGVFLDVEGDLPNRLAFPGRTGFGFSADIASRAAAAITARAGRT